MKQYLIALITITLFHSSIFSQEISPLLNLELKQTTNQSLRSSSTSNKIYGLTIKVNDDFSKSELESIGGKINTDVGEYLTVQVPSSSINEFIKLNGLVKVELGSKIQLHNDNAISASNIDDVQNGFLSSGQRYFGQDIVVGVVDVGFQYDHPTFFDTTGTKYRVKRVWEQKGTGTPPSGKSYGRELTDSASIIDAQTDDATNFHGTHTAGTAGGSGFGSTNREFSGVAPMADLMFVAADLAEDNPVTDGIDYIFDYAESVGKPAVINLSLGSNKGLKDGSSSVNQVINGLVGPGKLVVASAGNSGNKTLHVSGDFNTSDTISIKADNLSNYTYGVLVVDVMRAGDFCITLETRKASDNSAIATSSTHCSSDAPHNSFDYNQSTIQSVSLTSPLTTAIQMNGELIENQKVYGVVQVATTPENINFFNTDLYIHVTYDDTEDNKLDDTRDEVMHAWNTLGHPLASSNADSLFTVSEDYASADSVIAVGAYTTKNNYTDVFNNSIDIPSYSSIGDIATFSSIGPRTDGKIKPDIAAPGNVVVSGMNRFYTDLATAKASGNILDSVLFNGNYHFYSATQGTSMAGPVVTGSMALLLEQENDLTPTRALDLVHNNAGSNAFTGTLPNAYWGYGILDVFATMENAILTPANNSISPSDVNYPKVYPNPSNGFSISLDANGNSIEEISIHSIDGRFLFSQAINNELTPIDVSALGSGTYLVYFKGKKSIETGKLIIQ